VAYEASQPLREGHERLEFAIFLAIALHLMLILGLSFDASKPNNSNSQIEVTLTTLPSEQAPDKTKLLAAQNQLGSGDTADRDEITSKEASPQPQTIVEEFSSQTVPQQQLQHSATPATATAAAAQSFVTKIPESQEQLREPNEGVNPEVERLAQELANLEARLDEQSRAYSTMPRVRRLTSASAKRAIDAAYLLQWRQRVEAVGNKYYPEASERYGIYGSLRLLVIIRRDGSLEDIKVLSSSGHAVLDEAAIKIVRLAAPFAPFSAQLRATTDKLEIIRTWQFRENRLSSG